MLNQTPWVEFCTLDNECAYLPNKKSRFFYKYIPQASKTLSSELIKRGYRRFGNYYFHPICNGCNECKSLRIDVKNFKPSRSQRRAFKKNKNTKIYISKPSLTKEHITLYNKYHKFKAKKSGWVYNEIDFETYYEEFVAGAGDFGKEVLYFIDERLAAVDLIDILDDGISSIYFFYDPDFEKYSLGIFSLLIQIELAKRYALDWIYLGYWVEGCKSFEYKTNFKPYQLLDDFPSLSQIPNWKEA